MIEVALAQKEGGRIRATYSCTQFVDELRTQWRDRSNLCDRRLSIAKSENVVMLGRVA